MTMLDRPQAAEYVLGSGGKPNTLANWRSQKIGPRFCKHGQLVRYSQEDLDDYIASRMQGTTDQPVSTKRTPVAKKRAARKRVGGAA